MGPQPLVSVIVPIYNGEEYISDCLRSIYEQTYSPIEVIVVDDGSTDHSLDIIERFPGEKKIIRQEHLNLPSARNAGIRAASGELIAFLDADDVWLPGKIKRQVEIYKSHPDVHLVFTDVIRFYPSGKKRHADGKAAASRKINRRSSFPLLVRQDLIVPSSVLVRREVFDIIGLFDETFFSCEDWEFWLRMSLNGCKMRFLDEILVFYRCHDNNMSRSIKLMHEGRSHVLDKFFKRSNLPPKYKRLEAECFARIHYLTANSYYSIGEVEKFLEYFQVAWRLNKRVVPIKALRRRLREAIRGLGKGV